MSQTIPNVMRSLNPRIVILTGAGLSAESGIDTFRGEGGVWEKYRVEDVATPESFKQTPDKVHAFYNLRRRQLEDERIKPNKAHEALAKLDKALGADVLMVTQNVDNLLEQAGAKVLHMHGELSKIRCENCAKVSSWSGDLSSATSCVACGTRGALRPHIVWFGEIPFGLAHIYKALAHCELFAAIGTSGSVSPASGFVQEARKSGCRRTVEINPTQTEISGFFDEVITGPATERVPGFVDEILEGAVL